jgi:hypothetical protein
MDLVSDEDVGADGDAVTVDSVAVLPADALAN